MYYLVTWKDWKSGATMSMRLTDKDVTKLVAILVNSIKPGYIEIKQCD